MADTDPKHGSPGSSGRPVCLLTFALGLLACALAGCPRREAPPETPPPAPPPVQGHLPQAGDYPTLAADPERALILDAYLEAWASRERSPDAYKQALDPFLTVYREAYDALPKAGDAAEYDRALRLLWDLCGIVHSTTISPEVVKHTIDWREPVTTGEPGDAEVSLVDATREPLRTRLESLPGTCLALLRAVPVGAEGGPSYLDYVAEQTRQVYLTPQLPEWSPSCPMDVCGTSEPLTRTLILVSAGYIDLSPKPDWSLAAVAVHEAAHIAWFHSDEVAADPRLLLPTPNERNAFAQMAAFLRGMLSLRDPELKAYVDRHREAMQDRLVEAHRRANSGDTIPNSHLPKSDRRRRE